MAMLTRGVGFTRVTLDRLASTHVRAERPEPQKGKDRDRAHSRDLLAKSDLIEKTQLRDFAERQLRGLQHGLLQG